MSKIVKIAEKHTKKDAEVHMTMTLPVTCLSQQVLGSHLVTWRQFTETLYDIAHCTFCICHIRMSHA